jgi:hypothetical protein
MKGWPERHPQPPTGWSEREREQRQRERELSKRQRERAEREVVTKRRTEMEN